MSVEQHVADAGAAGYEAADTGAKSERNIPHLKKPKTGQKTSQSSLHPLNGAMSQPIKGVKPVEKGLKMSLASEGEILVLPTARKRCQSP